MEGGVPGDDKKLVRSEPVVIVGRVVVLDVIVITKELGLVHRV